MNDVKFLFICNPFVKIISPKYTNFSKTDFPNISSILKILWSWNTKLSTCHYYQYLSKLQSVRTTILPIFSKHHSIIRNAIFLKNARLGDCADTRKSRFYASFLDLSGFSSFYEKKDVPSTNFRSFSICTWAKTQTQKYISEKRKESSTMGYLIRF